MPGEQVSAYREPREEHYEPLLIRTRPIILTCAAATLALIVICCIMVPSNVARVALAGAVLVAGISTFVAGSCFRLSDLRKRTGSVFRNLPDAETRLRALPPRETIGRRLRIAKYAAIAGCLGLIAVPVVSRLTGADSQVTNWAALAALLGAVLAALVYIAATYTRPLD